MERNIGLRSIPVESQPKHCTALQFHAGTFQIGAAITSRAMCEN